MLSGTADLSGDIGAVTDLSSLRPTLTVTGLDKGAPEKLSGRRDGAMTFAAFWNVDTGQSHPTFSAMPRTDVQSSIVIGTPALDSPMASMVAKQVDYASIIGADGSLGATVQMLANGYGLEWGELLTVGKQSFATGTVSGTSINFGAVSSAFGAAVANSAAPTL